MQYILGCKMKKKIIFSLLTIVIIDSISWNYYVKLITIQILFVFLVSLRKKVCWIVFYFDFFITKLFVFVNKGGKKYLLVLEYADSGTLRSYLHENFESINWDLKLKFAHEITLAVLCLHENDIIHRDLVTK